MALAKGVNSYATVDEAEIYFLDRLDVVAWTSAPIEQRSQALVTATSMLDELQWVGTAISDSQSLAFPRSGQYFDPRLGTTVYLDNNVPNRVINATYEQAYHLLNNDGLLDEIGVVKDLSVSSIKLENIRLPSRISASAKRLLKPLMINNSSNLWWRAN
jgi:hypothetical protein